jgi:cytochrome c oxidase subunit II
VKGFTKTGSPVTLLAAALTGLGVASIAYAQQQPSAASARPFQWADWWLPSLHSEHGAGMDALFVGIFWITTVALVLVQGVLVWFLIKYRRRDGAGPRKAHFIHGNTRLEMAWTLAPAVILAVLALLTKQVWANYRAPVIPEGGKAQMMVIGEQFKWNVIYPGPDGEIGRYLNFPKPSDPAYRRYRFDEAVSRINTYINDENPHGKDVKDPAGEDDDWEKFPGRPIVVPVDKTVEILLGSKDVLHSFFLPNFRVKLDAVPGMIGRIYFKPTPDAQSTTATPLDQVKLNDRLWVDRDTKGVSQDADQQTFTLPDPASPSDQSFERVGKLGSLKVLVDRRLTAQNVAAPTPEQYDTELQKLKDDLKKAGVTELFVVRPWEVVCAELCGQGHSTMGAQLIVLSGQQYINFIHKDNPPTGTSPTTQPAGAPSIATAEK